MADHAEVVEQARQMLDAMPPNHLTSLTTHNYRTLLISLRADSTDVVLAKVAEALEIAPAASPLRPLLESMHEDLMALGEAKAMQRQHGGPLEVIV